MDEFPQDEVAEPKAEKKQPNMYIYSAGKIVETIDPNKATVITKAGCTHDYVADPTDVTDGYMAEMCSKCPQGRLVPVVSSDNLN